MTSKENLEVVIIEYKKELEEDSNNQWIKNRIIGLENCLKDLEVLEILKKHLLIDKFDSITYIDSHYSKTGEEDFNKIKEWLSEVEE